MKPLSIEQRMQLKNDVIAIGLLMGVAFFINRGIEIKGLYMDDLYLWSCYGEQSFLQYVFPIGSTRFRFLYYLAAWLELALIGPHIEWLVPINILLNGMLAAFLYYLGRRMSGRPVLGFFGGVLFLLSRMSYYQIGQMYGLMETMAMWMAIGIFCCLYRYLNEKREAMGYFYGACWLYLGICFVHERYMALLPLFYLALILRRRFQLKKWLWPLGMFLIVQAVRFFTIGSLSPAGTGGTQVADTFSVMEAIRYALCQVAYVFGINAGPQHLNGLTWADTPGRIKGLVYGADVVLALLLLAFLVKIIRDKEKRGSYLANAAMFLTFIALCIGASSVTVRVEMRWVYVSYSAALLFLNYICGVLAPRQPADGTGEEKNSAKYGTSMQGAISGDSAEANFLAQHRKRTLHKREHSVWPAAWCIGGFLLYLVLMVPVELFFRGHYPNLYLWPNQMRYNSLAEETYGRYGEEIFGKTIYIIGNTYEMSEFTADTFFKVFDKERKAEGTQVVFADSVREIGLVTDDMLVLQEEPEHEGFRDITQVVREQKLKVDYGLYGDGWMDEECSFSILTGAEGTVNFQFLYPAELSGGEQTEVYVNGERYQRISVKETSYSCQIKAQPYQMLDVQIKSNFYVPNAQEQRGATRLTVLTEISVE